MADTHVDIAMYGHSFVAGDVLYASVYLATGEHVRHGGICPPPRDQSVRDVYRYPAGARRVHHFRMQLEMYFGAPPLFFVPADDPGIELGKDRVRTLVDRYQQHWWNERVGNDDPLPRKKVSKAELEAMVCHNGQWYADEHELDKAIEQKKCQAELPLWAIPDAMLEPTPRKALVRRSKKRWIV
jgi:hypothetical protein